MSISTLIQKWQNKVIMPPKRKLWGQSHFTASGPSLPTSDDSSQSSDSSSSKGETCQLVQFCRVQMEWTLSMDYGLWFNEMVSIVLIMHKGWLWSPVVAATFPEQKIYWDKAWTLWRHQSSTQYQNCANMYKESLHCRTKRRKIDDLMCSNDCLRHFVMLFAASISLQSTKSVILPTLHFM